MNILICNAGLSSSNEVRSLADALNKKHKVTVACMMKKSSARGLSFSPKDIPVHVNEIKYGDVPVYEFGTKPADAVSITLTDIMAHKKPDLVICGINNGVHFGQDIYCSSNIGMAMESAFFNVPTIAIAVENKPSGNTPKELANAITFIEKNAEKFAKLGLPRTTFLNINVPSVARYTQLKGVKVARMGQMSQLSTYTEKRDVLGNVYYWANNVTRENVTTGEEFARTWFDKKYITIVPLSYDSTDYNAVEEWDKTIRTGIKNCKTCNSCGRCKK